MQAGVGERETGKAAQHTDCEALLKQLKGHASAGCAKSGPKREFVLPAFGAHEKKVGDVCASDEQNDSDSAHHNPKQPVHVTNNLFFQRAEAWAEPGLFKQIKTKTGPGRKRLESDRKHSRDIGAASAIVVPGFSRAIPK